MVVGGRGGAGVCTCDVQEDVELGRVLVVLFLLVMFHLGLRDKERRGKVLRN